MDILLLEWFVTFLWHILVQKCPTHLCLWSVYNSVDTWTVAPVDSFHCFMFYVVYVLCYNSGLLCSGSSKSKSGPQTGWLLHASDGKCLDDSLQSCAQALQRTNTQP